MSVSTCWALWSRRASGPTCCATVSPARCVLVGRVAAAGCRVQISDAFDACSSCRVCRVFAMPCMGSRLSHVTWQLQPCPPLAQVGGRPAWLDPLHLPSPEQLTCRVTGKPLEFLLQVRV